MKVHYINILLFALRLNILLLSSQVRIHRNHYITTHTQTSRSLCECELYAPANYDNDAQMKSVMDNFNKQTQERFHEYDDRMVRNSQKCKERCDKEIQKIILKDKLERELMDKFATLRTDIQSDAIPTCVCEKSVADKTEKFCLNCGMNVGGVVTLSSGVLGGISIHALNAWYTEAIAAATKYSMTQGLVKGLAAGIQEGKNTVIAGLKALDIWELGIVEFDSFFTEGYFIDVLKLTKIISTKKAQFCSTGASRTVSNDLCDRIGIKLGIFKESGGYGPPDSDAIPQTLNGIVTQAKEVAGVKASDVISRTSSKIMTKKTALIEGGFDSSISSINAAIIAIVVIVLIMVIIYLILRYRRKKKMKKKLQYIKLLEE